MAIVHYGATIAWRPHNYKKINGKKEHSKNSFKGLSQRLKKIKKTGTDH